MSELLDRINSPADIRGLDTDQLEALCREIREYMVDCCSRNPGHLASSLGAVEIITAVHYVFNTPEDKFVFDVGHQAYAHKILTGRREAFKDMRTAGGISGFPKIDESPYDAFGVGHSSTSISAAFGMAEAARLNGENRKVIALIGDGALTGGLAFEGLNNAGDSSTDLLVILNDNNQSIDPNRGALHRHLLRFTTTPAYNRIKDQIWDAMGQTRTRLFIQRWVRAFKSWIVKRSGGDLFESLGFRYFGPIDGNDIGKMTDTLRKLSGIKGPRLLHCITTKGKGYAPAENDPTVWHAPGKFDPSTGIRIPARYTADRFQDVFGQTLVDLAAADKRVVGITPAMASGCGMTALQKAFPERFFDVGIEEEHAVTFAAGLAVGGLKPVCNLYSSFAQRAYDQIIHDVALQHLPVVICLDRAGLVGEDGPTHHGAFDLAAFRSIPGTTVAAPADEAELRDLMYTALQQDKGPFIIRYPRGVAEGVLWRDQPFHLLPVGRGQCVRRGTQLAVLALGPVVYRAVKAAEEVFAETGIQPSIYNIRYIKPLDEDLLEQVAAGHEAVLTLEDGTLEGGLFGAVCEYMASHGHLLKISGAGIPDRFIAQARQSEELAECGLDTASIRFKMLKLLQKD